MRIDKKIHSSHPWKVNKIAEDFILWDVWDIPISADNSKTQNFQAFYRIAMETFGKIQKNKSLANFLFALRNWLGKIFPLDKNINTLPVPGCLETSVRSRLKSKDLGKSKKGNAIKLNSSGLEFRPVYLYKDESLHELSNDTVHALIHVGWIKKMDTAYNATLAIYVKPRGLYGKIYLKLIEPFRRYIVYPAMMKAIMARWGKYLLSLN